jgi:hypothetical protein
MHQRPITLDPEALLTEVDAADLFKLSIRTLQAWRSKGIGPAFVRLGRAVRYRRADLLAWLNARAVRRSMVSSRGENAAEDLSR